MDKEIYDSLYNYIDDFSLENLEYTYNDLKEYIFSIQGNLRDYDEEAIQKVLTDYIADSEGLLKYEKGIIASTLNVEVMFNF